MKTPVWHRVQRTVADLFALPVAEIMPETTPDTIETWDSLQHLNLVLAIEQEFGVQFAPEDIAQILCVEDIVTLLTEKLQSTESPL